jgi:hypothetical protein
MKRDEVTTQRASAILVASDPDFRFQTSARLGPVMFRLGSSE